MDHPIRIKSISSVYRLNVTAYKDSRTNRKTNAIAFKTAGKTVYSVGDEKIVSCPGKAVLLGKGSSYDIEYVEPGECFLIDFETEDGSIDERVISLSFGTSAVLTDLLSDIERVFTYKRPFFEYELISKVYKLLHHVLVFDNDGYLPKSKIRLLEPAIKYIEENYASDTTDNNTLAAVAGISVSYFRRLFQNVYKIPPAKYIQSLRLSKAKEMLLEGSLSIAEIAEKSGFGSVYYFDNCFKKETGMTPSQFVRSVITSL